MNYMQTVNHPNYQQANLQVRSAVRLLQALGMTQDEARQLVRDWTSGAGDGAA